MKDTFTLQQKTKLLSKLFDSGINTEKKLQQLDMERILKITGITIPEMNLIIELQKQTKANKLYSYLGGGADIPFRGTCSMRPLKGTICNTSTLGLPPLVRP